MNKCHKCGKPVYFAERKTSLGKEWHPSCLRCGQCEKVLTPGQHAEHKGYPYCNKCYQALFGPQMFGYGSNVFSQANYRRKQTVSIKDQTTNEVPTLQKSQRSVKESIQLWDSGNVVAVTPSDTKEKNDKEDSKEKYEKKRGGRLEDVKEEEEGELEEEDEDDDDNGEDLEAEEQDTFDCDTLKTRSNPYNYNSTGINSLPKNRSDTSITSLNTSLENGHGPSAMDKERSVLLNNHSDTSFPVTHSSTISSSSSSTSSSSSSSSSSSLNYSNSFSIDQRTLPARNNKLSSPVKNNSLSSLNSQGVRVLPFMLTSQKIFGTLSSPLNLDTLTSPINYGTLAKIFENGILPNQDQENQVSPRQKILEQVQSYNAFYEGKRGCLTMNQINGEDVIEGQLRIYWQVTIPIQLKHCDDVPVPPIASWRHSYYAAIGNGFDVDGPDIQLVSLIDELSDEDYDDNYFDYSKSDSLLLSPLFRHSISGFDFELSDSPSASPKKYGLDDSLIIPSSDGVVRRRNIRKSNTVAYRADRPNKWKRASINGHIYNYDTRVFTPVIGSCTSVTVNNSMTVPHVIKTLLEKFKVENDAEEFSLYVVTEAEGERELRSNDVPLLERLSLGPDETNAKIFIREKDFQTSIVVEETESLEEKTLNLPAEIQHTLDAVKKGTFEINIVEQLMALPDGVLKGLLQKFMDDEEKDVQKIKDKYSKIKTVMNNYLSLSESTETETKTATTENPVTAAQ